MRFSYECPACGDDHDDEVHTFYEGGWTWQGGPALGEPLPCGELPTTDHIAHIEGVIIDRIVHAGEPSV